MKGVIVSFTAQGSALGEKIRCALAGQGWDAETFVKSKYAGETGAQEITEPLNTWLFGWWKRADAVIFVGAVGIAVRTIAPFVKSKKEDPAILCVDEKGTYCIPILSGHLGGANALAEKLSQEIGSLAVITTATDLNTCFAVDLFAKAEGNEIRDMKQAKEISAALLAGRRIVTAGVGCRRGTPADEVLEALRSVCRENKIDLNNLKQIVSVDLKKDEEGLIETAKACGVPFVTYSSDELLKLPGDYTPSLFVKEITGVDNVCERSAVKGSGMGILIQRKKVYGRVTAALAIEAEGEAYEA